MAPRGRGQTENKGSATQEEVSPPAFLGAKLICLQESYTAINGRRKKYGKHTVCLGSSFLANTASQHANEQGDQSERSKYLLPGETKRKRLGIPMFLGEVV
jgi:hypothetical protein